MQSSSLSHPLRVGFPALFAAGLLILAVALLGAPTASAAPGDRIDVEYSADGETWGGPEQIPWDSRVVIPGGPPNATSVYIRASEDVPVDASIYLGNWRVSAGSAWFQVDVDGVEGERVTLSAGSDVEPGVLMSRFSLEAGESVQIALKVGLPAEETVQGATISPGWSIQFAEAEEPEGPQPEAPGSGSSVGSLDLGDIASTGSAGSLGSSGVGQPIGSTIDIDLGSHVAVGSLD